MMGRQTPKWKRTRSLASKKTAPSLVFYQRNTMRSLRNREGGLRKAAAGQRRPDHGRHSRVQVAPFVAQVGCQTDALGLFGGRRWRRHAAAWLVRDLCVRNQESDDHFVLRPLHKSIARKFYETWTTGDDKWDESMQSRYAVLIEQEPPNSKQISPVSCHWKEVAKADEPNCLYRRKPSSKKDDDDDDEPPMKQAAKKQKKEVRLFSPPRMTTGRTQTRPLPSRASRPSR